MAGSAAEGGGRPPAIPRLSALVATALLAVIASAATNAGVSGKVQKQVVMFHQYPVRVDVDLEARTAIVSPPDNIPGIGRSRTFYDYNTRVIAYKDYRVRQCHLERMSPDEKLPGTEEEDVGAEVREEAGRAEEREAERRLHRQMGLLGPPTPRNRQRRAAAAGKTDAHPIPMQRSRPKTMYVTETVLSKYKVLRLAGRRIAHFCRGFPATLLVQRPPSPPPPQLQPPSRVPWLSENELPGDGDDGGSEEQRLLLEAALVKARLAELEMQTLDDNSGEDKPRSRKITKGSRSKRQATSNGGTRGWYWPRKFRGQTQSQFVSFSGDGKNEGTAQAEARPEGTTTLVRGANGMGQSQSQSSVGDDCDGCFPGGYGVAGYTAGGGGPWQQPGYDAPGGAGGRTPGAMSGLPGGANGGRVQGVGGRGYTPDTAGYGRPGSPGAPGYGVPAGTPGGPSAGVRPGSLVHRPGIGGVAGGPGYPGGEVPGRGVTTGPGYGSGGDGGMVSPGGVQGRPSYPLGEVPGRGGISGRPGYGSRGDGGVVGPTGSALGGPGYPGGTIPGRGVISGRPGHGMNGNGGVVGPTGGAPGGPGYPGGTIPGRGVISGRPGHGMNGNGDVVGPTGGAPGGPGYPGGTIPGRGVISGRPGHGLNGNGGVVGPTGGAPGGPGYPGGTIPGRGVISGRPGHGMNGNGGGVGPSGGGGVGPSGGGVGGPGYPGHGRDAGYGPGATNGHHATHGAGYDGTTVGGPGYGILPGDLRKPGYGQGVDIHGHPGVPDGAGSHRPHDGSHPGGRHVTTPHSGGPGYGHRLPGGGGVQPSGVAGTIPSGGHHGAGHRVHGGVTQPGSHVGYPSSPGHHETDSHRPDRHGGHVTGHYIPPGGHDSQHLRPDMIQRPHGGPGAHGFSSPGYDAALHAGGAGRDGRHDGGLVSPSGVYPGSHIPSGHGRQYAPHDTGLYPTGHGTPGHGLYGPGTAGRGQRPTGVGHGYREYPSGSGGSQLGGVGPGGAIDHHARGHGAGPGDIGTGPGGILTGPGGDGAGPGRIAQGPGGAGVGPGGGGVGPGGVGLGPGRVGLGPGGRGVGPGGVGLGPGGAGVGPGGRGLGPSGSGVGPSGGRVGPSGGAPGGMGVGAGGRGTIPSGPGGMGVGAGGRGTIPSGPGGMGVGLGAGGHRPDTGLGPGMAVDRPGGVGHSHGPGVGPTGRHYYPSGSGAYGPGSVDTTGHGYPVHRPGGTHPVHDGRHPSQIGGYDRFPAGSTGHDLHRVTGSGSDGLQRGQGAYPPGGGVLIPEAIASRGHGRPSIDARYPDSGGALGPGHGRQGINGGVQRPDGTLVSSRPGRPGERHTFPGGQGYIPGQRITGGTPGYGIAPGTPGYIPTDGQVQYGRPGYYNGQDGAHPLTRPGVGGRTPGGAAAGGESQAQSSVIQDDKEIKAGASSQGKFGDEKAQAQVSGSYTGTGSFSAQAQTSDGRRGAQSQVTGNKDGGSSSAQGNGGVGQSQAQVQLSAGNGATKAEAQSGGWQHGSNTQVQAGENGGMADAQSSGPGTTSSQAQVGFKPNRGNGNGQRTPFRGGGTASAQSGSYSGQSQSQVQGSYRYGVTFQGAAQAGTSARGSRGISGEGRNGTRFERDDHAALIPDSVKLPPLKRFGDINNRPDDSQLSGGNVIQNGKNEQPLTQISTPSPLSSHHIHQKPDSIHTPMQGSPQNTLNSNNGNHLNNGHSRFSESSNALHGSHSLGSPNVHQSGHNSFSSHRQYSSHSIHGSPIESASNNNAMGHGHDENKPLILEGNKDQINRQNSESVSGHRQHDNKFSGNGDSPKPIPLPHKSSHRGDITEEGDAGKPKVFKTEAPRQSQSVFVSPMSNEDVHITQASDGGGIPAQAVFQPGDLVPGTDGFRIPEGFRGRVIGDSRSIAGDETLAIASPNNGNSQSQTVVVTPGSGKINYTRIVRPPNGKPVVPAYEDYVDNQDDSEDEYDVPTHSSGHRVQSHRGSDAYSRGDQPVYPWNKPNTRNAETKPQSFHKDEDEYEDEDEEEDIEDDEPEEESQPSTPPPPIPNSYVSVTKSVSGQLNPVNMPQGKYDRQFPNGSSGLSGSNGGKFAHTYYTKSSTCGYFTFSCNVVFGSNGRAKICKPRPPTNPDGSPCCC